MDIRDITDHQHVIKYLIVSGYLYVMEMQLAENSYY